MLSLPTTRAVVGCLLHADAHAPTNGRAGPALLLLIQQPVALPGGPLRALHLLTFPLSPQNLAAHPQGIPAVLHDLATRLGRIRARVRPAAPAISHAGCVHRRVRAAVHTHTGPGTRLVAWAVRYDDLLADVDTPCAVGRIDAVDADGRLYQITQLPGTANTVVLVEEQPDPDDTPGHPARPGRAGSRQCPPVPHAPHRPRHLTHAATKPGSGHQRHQGLRKPVTGHAGHPSP